MQKIKFPIGFKLINIITVLVLISLGAVTYIVSYFVGDETKRTAEENNYTLNSRSAVSAESELTTIRSNSFLLLDMLSSAGNSNAIARQATTFFFERNQETAAIILYNVETDRNDRTLINSRFFLSNELDEGMLNVFQTVNKEEFQRSARGEVFVLSGTPVFGIPMLALLYPWEESGLQQAVVVLFSAESLVEAFGTGSVNESFIVNHNNDLLVHSDFELIKAGANFSDMTIIQDMRANNDLNRQMVFKDKDGQEFYGSYNKLSIGDCGVITTI